MTVEELKKRCDEMIADGYEDSEIFLCVDNDYLPLENGFSSVAYNEGADEQIFKNIAEGMPFISSAEINALDEAINTGRFIILN
jgi:hypothetical protein